VLQALDLVVLVGHLPAQVAELLGNELELGDARFRAVQVVQEGVFGGSNADQLLLGLFGLLVG
jgi:hypothetical protein